MATPKNSLKIGMVLDDGLDKPDGVQQYILALGTWLQSQGHEVHYLVGQTSRTDIKGVHSMSRNVRVRFNGNRLTMPLPTSKRRLKAFLNKEKFDVLHVQVPYSPFMGHQLIMAAGPKTAIVGTFHIAPNNRLVSIGNRGLGILLRRTLKRFDVMLSVSRTAADFARATFGIDSQVLPNVIDYPRFHDAKPLPIYDINDTLTILYLGRLVPRKGCLKLLKAINQLKDREGLPKFRVVVCGTGPLEKRLKEYVTNNNLGKLVEFAGFISEDEKPRYYASADISVFPSSGGESFGIVLLEAMASGKAAVLAGNNPGYRSVLAERPELLFSPYDEAMLASLLADYLQHQEQRDEVRRWGADFTKDFDVAVVGKQLLGVYQEALHKRTNP